MNPFYADEAVALYHGDALAVLAELDTASVDAVCTDPPYELSFMGRAWDASGIAYNVELWRHCLRVLKPGGHLLASGGTRTWHRLACAVEDAGFEIRDTISWLYGSGFPKSLDVSKAIDKAAGAQREVIGQRDRYRDGHERQNLGDRNEVYGEGLTANGVADITAPATDDARRWSGWGTALKPAHEPVIHAVKPFSQADILVQIGSHLDRLETEWLALAADQTTRTGAAAGSSDPTGMLPSASTAPTGLNIVSSWRGCWDALCSEASTSTTATTSSTTTDLKTLSSCLSRLTAESMRANLSPSGGLSSLAEAADSLFAAALLRSRATLALSAAGSATGPAALLFPAGAATSPDLAHEPIVVARKPLSGTVAANVIAHGTGALNIDACRVPGEHVRTTSGKTVLGVMNDDGWQPKPAVFESHDAGRWPSNVVLDEAAAGELDRQSGVTISTDRPRRNTAEAHNRTPSMGKSSADWTTSGYEDTGGASRFFPTFRYEAKAPTTERPRDGGTAHPTVKPLDLMRWLVRLITPPGGVCLDPFAGSGTTAEACVIEGFRCITVEREADYLPLIVARLVKPLQPVLEIA